MNRIFATLEFRWFACILVQLPFAAYASTTHDANDDGQVTIVDFASLQRCFPLGASGNCAIFDADTDSDLDGDDFNNFLNVNVLKDPNWVPLPDAELDSSGYPRPWEGALPISDFSVYNLAQGNVLTTIPLVSWNPVGPPVHFELYHNSAMANAGVSAEDGMGFDLGDGWSTTYSSKLTIRSGVVTLREDDGTLKVFTDKSGVWTPPVGVYDKLEQVTEGLDTFWILTRPSQTQRKFSASGRLLSEIDSSGNAVEIEWSAEDYMRYVVSSASLLPDVGHNRLSIFYSSANNLVTITDPIGRDWYLHLNAATGRLEEVNYPNDTDIPDASNAITYDDDGRILRICRRDRVSWEYSYDADGRFLEAVGPYSATGQMGSPPSAPPAGTPSIEISNGTGLLILIKDECVCRRGITDRRGNQWWFDFDNAAPHGRLLVAQYDPLDTSLTRPKRYEYDAQHNITQFTNELGKSWNATYGPLGNLTQLQGPSVGSPAARQTWDVTWDVVGDPDTSNFYRVTQVEDPADKWVRYEYADPNDPSDPNDATLVTKVIEMPAATGDPNAVTEFHYYWSQSTQTSNHGQLWYVKDANGVITHWEYDDYGYFETLLEGLYELPEARTVINPPRSGPMVNGPMGGARGGNGDTGSGAAPPECINVEDEYICFFCGERGPGMDDEPPRLSNSPAGNPTPYWNAKKICLYEADYGVMGRPLSIVRSESRNDTCIFPCRDYEISYDDLGRLEEFDFFGPGIVDAADPNTMPPPEQLPLTLSLSLETTDSQDPAYDEDGRILWLKDENNMVTSYSYDELGRIETVVRNDGEATAFSVAYTYDDAGRVTQITNSNGSRELRTYDDANRLTQITHQNASQQNMVRVTYTWTNNNWLDSRTEEDWTSGSQITTVVDFTYDNRGRLVQEERDQGAVDVYDISYTYDQLGNRLSKIDADSGLWTEYDYDVELADPNALAFPTWHNRLLEYRIYDGDPNDPGTTLLRTVNYTYYKTGEASNITIKDEDPDPDPVSGADPAYDKYKDIALYYYSHGGLWRTIWGEFERDDQTGDAENYVPTAAREFFSDTPRKMLTVLDYDVNNSIDPNDWTLESHSRTDHIGDLPYRDMTVDSSWDSTEVMQYLGTVAQQPVNSSGVPTDLNFLHGDLVGSTMAVSDDSGGSDSSVSYTAFGEVIGDPNNLGSDTNTVVPMAINPESSPSKA